MFSQFESRSGPSRARATVLFAGVVGAAITASLMAGSAATSQSPKPSPSSPPSPAPAPAPAKASAVETFKVDPGHSVALFRVQHLGAGAFWGRFDAVSGTITSDSASANGLSFNITIDVNSVNTASEQRDNHLKSPDFFSAKEFPTMTFKSTSAKKLEGSFYSVTGDLTMRGVTKPVTAKIEWTGTADMGMGRRAGFEATFVLDRGDFGVDYGVEKGAVGNQVRVVVALEGIIEK